MKRRLLLQRLLQSSGTLITAGLLPACGKRIDPLFSLDLDPAIARLPDHLITPLSEFYVQSYALAPRLNRQDWRLKFHGAVAQPLTLSFEEILAAPQEEFYLTMECIGNPTGGNLIGNARWRGTPLLPFLQRSQVQPEVVEFRLHGADFYETTLPAAALMAPQVYLVHEMNAAPLTQAHGYPMRILIPGHFGQKQPKWLVGIEAITTAKRGFWERQGWSNQAEIPTHALMRQVQSERVWNRHAQVILPPGGDAGWEQGVQIAGIALDKMAPIQAIQLSLDGGQTWEQAEQNHPASPHEWTLWRYLWRPLQPGKYQLLARAHSQRQQQPLEDHNPKDGSSGVLKIQVTLQS